MSPFSWMIAPMYWFTPADSFAKEIGRTLSMLLVNCNYFTMVFWMYKLYTSTIRMKIRDQQTSTTVRLSLISSNSFIDRTLTSFKSL